MTPPWRWRSATPATIGIGAFNLLRTSAYQQLGGFDALRMEILEDLTLARRVKLASLQQRVAIAPGMVSLHWAAGANGIINVMTKNLFAIFRFRIILVLATGLALTALCLGPFLLLPETLTPAILTLISITALYVLSFRHSKISPWYALLFPAAAILFLYALFRSAFATLHAGGVTWRGTFYPLAELRNNLTSL